MPRYHFCDDNFDFYVVSAVSMPESDFSALVEDYASRWYDCETYPDYEQACIGDVICECFQAEKGISVDIQNCNYYLLTQDFFYEWELVSAPDRVTIDTYITSQGVIDDNVDIITDSNKTNFRDDISEYDYEIVYLSEYDF